MKTVRFILRPRRHSASERRGGGTGGGKEREKKMRAFHLYARLRSNEKDRSRMESRLEYHRTNQS